MARYTKEEQIEYQKNKIKYHISRLKRLGLSDTDIINFIVSIIK